MKKHFLSFVFILFISFYCLAQTPDAFNYQAVIRNSSDELLSNQDVGIRISIYEGSNPGTNLFSETHSVTTDTYGVISISIGNGSLISGNFSEIDWTTGNKYLKVEVDEAGGTSYSNMGMVKLLSVPYALSSKSAENLGANNIYTPGSDTLFVVKDYDGNVVFAVFPDGAAVYVNETSKGKVGGFAVSGRSPNKTTEEEYLVVTADSTRVYVNETEKGKVGGFAVSGRSPNKAEVSSLMDLTKENYFIGHEAGTNTTVGLFNTFLGFYSGFTNTEGYSNIFIGDSSGYYNESGSDNIFIGNTTGKSNISGYRNVFLGNKSGYNNQTGRFNVFIGDKTGVENTTGQQNVIIGATSGYFNTTGYRNVFVGNWCGYNNTVGSDNIFFGNRSGWNNTEGANNIFIGSYSGFANTTAENNIFIGNASGNLNETGSENIFIGRESGHNNVSGDLNTCIGFQSGYNLDTANYNTFLGFWSGRSNINGALNTFLGAQAGEFAEDGNLNVIVGAYAGSEGVVGNFNTFVGMRSGSKNEGNENTILGGFAGANNVNGSYNVFIGQASGEFSSGSGNVFIGNGTGSNNDGDNNVFIGDNAGSSIEGSNKLVISNWDADSSQALIYGEFDHHYLRFNGYLDGIKFLNSWNVDSNYISEGNYMTFAHPGVSEDFIGYKNNTFYFLDSPDGGDVTDPNVIVGGKVGIGILAPSQKLEVDGSINITGSYLVNGAKGSFADFVFENGYKLETIEEHADFMWENKHLPALKSAKEIKSEGSYDISERREQILHELEKAHIYIEQLNDKIKGLEKENSLLIKRLEAIEQRFKND
jgi:hypothetical protein